jgi:hypothetical protein
MLCVGDDATRAFDTLEMKIYRVRDNMVQHLLGSMVSTHLEDGESRPMIFY